MTQALPELDRLIETLQNAVDQRADRGDAIDRALAAPPRETQTRALTDEPAIARFREDLANGLVRLETTAAMLDVLSRVVRHLAGA